VGHVPDIRAAGIHVLIIHGGKDLGEFLTGVQRGNSGGSAALDSKGNAIQIIQIVQHEHLDLDNGCLLLTQLHLGLFVQVRKLSPGSFTGVFEFRLLHLGVAAGNGQHPLRLAVDHGRADGYAGKYRQSNALFHSILLIWPAR